MISPELEEAFDRIRAGKMVVLVGPSGEGDVVMAAEKVIPEQVNFMARYARGIVSVAIPERRLRELRIPLIPNRSGEEGAELVGASVEAREGTTTGISAGDRAKTIQTIASDQCGPDDIVMPGHVPPLMALPGGVLMRIGRAEGAVDLVRMAGMRPYAALCEILREDGYSARLPELKEFAQAHSLPICTTESLVAYRLTHELLVQRVEPNTSPVRHSECNRTSAGRPPPTSPLTRVRCSRPSMMLR